MEAVEKSENMENMLRRIIREELEDILTNSPQLKDEYAEELKRIENEEHIGFNSIEELDLLIKNA